MSEPNIILFMDDNPMRAVRLHEWSTEDERARTIWTKTVTETLIVLKGFAKDLETVSLDHDMEGEHFVDSRRPDCGMEVVRWLENIPHDKRATLQHVQFIVHSHNEKAARQMTERIAALGLMVRYEPFGIENG